MIKATCETCGRIFWGWALLDPKHQTCDCGEILKPRENLDKRKFHTIDPYTFFTNYLKSGMNYVRSLRAGRSKP